MVRFHPSLIRGGDDAGLMPTLWNASSTWSVFFGHRACPTRLSLHCYPTTTRSSISRIAVWLSWRDNPHSHLSRPASQQIEQTIPIDHPRCSANVFGCACAARIRRKCGEHCDSGQVDSTCPKSGSVRYTVSSQMAMLPKRKYLFE